MVWEWVTIQGAKVEGLTADELEWLFSCHLFADRILFRLSGFVLGVGISTWCPNLHFLTSDVSLSPCGHIEPNPAHGIWRVDST